MPGVAPSTADDRLRVFLIEPYYGGSHQQWADGYQHASTHDIHLVTHDARFWKWRMEGGHVTLARDAAALAARVGAPDLILASDMLNVPAFLGMARDAIGDAAVVVYMHENQLTYPASHLTQEDLTHAMINWTSVATSDATFFNSDFHRKSFFAALPELLRRFPDYRHSALLGDAEDRSSVLPVGIDLGRIDAAPRASSRPPMILWNQRWEFDKNPMEFFAALDELAALDVDFRVALAGEVFSTIPGEFELARDQLGDRVVHFGFADADDYVALLRSADVVVSTAHHEFFGVAIVEAIYAGAYPVLPNRLSYPGHIPQALHGDVLYEDFAGLVSLLTKALAAPADPGLRSAVSRYDWRQVAPAYDSALLEVVSWRRQRRSHPDP